MILSIVLKAGPLNRTIPASDGRAFIQPTFPDTEQALKVTDVPGSKGCSLSGLSTVDRNQLYQMMFAVQGEGGGGQLDEQSAAPNCRALPCGGPSVR
jgi:hypothetical protein